MQSSTVFGSGTSSNWRTHLINIALVLATAAVALGIGAAGAMKFLRPTDWRALFVGWGYPAWLTPIVGATELLAAVALITPRFAWYGIAILGIIMAGALTTLATHPGGRLGVGGTPAAYLCVISVIAAIRWTRRRALQNAQRSA